MNRKATYLMLAVLVVLLGLWWGQERWRARQSAEQSAMKPLVENFQPEAVDKIEIFPGKNLERLEVFRQHQGWLLASQPNLPADTDAVARLTSAIQRATVLRIAALTHDNLEQFGLEAENRATVRLLRGATVVEEFWLGASAEDYLSTAVARLNDPKIYAVENFTREDIAREWRDLTVLQFDRQRVTQIAYAQPRGGFTLARDDAGGWTLDGRLTKPDETKALVRELSNLRGNDVTATHATFTPTGTTIEINTPSGTQALLIGQAHPDGGVFVKNTAGFFYTLSKKTKEKILPTRRALLR